MYVCEALTCSNPQHNLGCWECMLTFHQRCRNASPYCGELGYEFDSMNEINSELNRFSKLKQQIVHQLNQIEEHGNKFQVEFAQIKQYERLFKRKQFNTHVISASLRLRKLMQQLSEDHQINKHLLLQQLQEIPFSINVIGQQLCLPIQYTKQVQVQDWQNIKGTWKYNEDYPITCICLGSHNLLAAGNKFGNITIWQFNPRNQREIKSAHNGKVTSIAFTHDSKYIISSAEDLMIKVWNSKLLSEISLIINPHLSTIVNNISISPFMTQFATSSSDLQIITWNLELSLNRITQHQVLKTIGKLIEYSPCGKMLLTLGQKVTLWNSKTSKDITNFSYSSKIHHAKFTSDNQRIFFSHENGTISIWSIQGKKQLQSLLFALSQTNLSISPQQNLIAMIYNGVTRIHNPQTMDFSQITHPHDNMTWIQFSNDGRFLFAASESHFYYYDAVSQ